MEKTDISIYLTTVDTDEEHKVLSEKESITIGAITVNQKAVSIELAFKEEEKRNKMMVKLLLGFPGTSVSDAENFEVNGGCFTFRFNVDTSKYRVNFERD